MRRWPFARMSGSAKKVAALVAGAFVGLGVLTLVALWGAEGGGGGGATVTLSPDSPQYVAIDRCDLSITATCSCNGNGCDITFGDTSWMSQPPTFSPKADQKTASRSVLASCPNAGKWTTNATCPKDAKHGTSNDYYVYVVRVNAVVKEPSRNNIYSSEPCFGRMV